MELEVYQKSDFYEDYISSQKEYYERENADAYFAERLADKDELIASLQDTNKVLARNGVRLNKILAEKDKEIALLKERICNGDVSRLTWIDDCIAKDKEIAELKQKLESVQASMYCDVVDANMENRRLKRALYKACANWADVEVFERTVGIDDPNVEANRWALMRNKCLKKAEEFK